METRVQFLIRVATFSTVSFLLVKFMFSKKATKNDLTVTTYCQIDGEDFVIFVAFLENTNFKVY